jgi:hypothetical protein
MAFFTGSLFFHDTVNFKCYINDILNLFFNQLIVEEGQYGHFQLDNVTVHMAKATMVAIQGVFEDRIISRGQSSPRSPDFSLDNFYLWRNLKGNFYKNNPCSTEAL